MNGKQFIEMFGEKCAYALITDYLDNLKEFNTRDYENLNVKELFAILEDKEPQIVKDFFDKEREEFAQFVAEHTFDVVIKCDLNEETYVYNNIVAWSEEDAFEVAKDQFTHAFLNIMSKKDYEDLEGGDE